MHAEHVRMPPQESVEGIAKRVRVSWVAVGQCPTFSGCWAVRRRGRPVDGLGLRPFIHVEGVAVVQYGGLMGVGDAWEGGKEYEWGDLFRAQGCREFERAWVCVDEVGSAAVLCRNRYRKRERERRWCVCRDDH
jgi:hypothetical protein